MSNIKIFRANRGEGKTKWLVERIGECKDAGYDLYYVGSSKTYGNVKRAYEATYGGVCPIHNMEGVMSSPNPCFFTDGLLSEVSYVAPYQNYIVNHSYQWYITMNNEDFVN